VTSVLVTLAALLLAAAATRTRYGAKLGRTLLAAGVIVLPVVWSLPGTLRHEQRLIRRDLGLTPVQAEARSPVYWAGYTNTPLLLGIREHVPRGARVTFLPGAGLARGRPPAEERARYLQTGWVRWAAFVIAPRLVVDDVSAPWVVLADQSPGAAGIRPRHAWRFGPDWLVER
jgi:hypothetical protein